MSHLTTESIESCYPRVLRALIATGAARDRAEDALHDALVALLRRQSAEPLERPDAWLFVVALRGLRRRGWREALERTRLFRPSARADPTVRLEVIELLAPLTGRERAMVVARYYLDLTHAEIAHEFGVSVSTSTSTIARALRHIREHEARLEVRLDAHRG